MRRITACLFATMVATTSLQVSAETESTPPTEITTEWEVLTTSGGYTCVKVISKNYALAANENGVIMVYDGQRWKGMTQPHFKCVSRIAANQRGDIWISCGWKIPDFRLYHFDGKSWTLVDRSDALFTDIWCGRDGSAWAATSDGVYRYSKNDEKSKLLDGPFSNIWGRHDREVFVTGPAGTLRYDGKGWKQLDENSPRFLHITGNQRSLYAHNPGGIYKYQHGQWARVYNTMPIFIADIAVDAQDNVYALDLTRGAVLRLTDESEEFIELPPSLSSHSIGASQDGTFIATGRGGLVRYHKNKLTAFPSPWTTIYDFDGSNENDLLAAGEYSVHYDGNTWTMSSLDSAVVTAIDMTETGEAHAVGKNKESQPAYFHFDGTRWTSIPCEPELYDVLEYRDQVYAVGVTKQGYRKYNCLFQLDNGQWKIVTTFDMVPGHLTAGPDGLVIGGLNDVSVAIWANGEWKEFPSGMNFPVRDMWTSPTGRTYASTAGARLGVFDGTEWQFMKVPYHVFISDYSDYIDGVWGTSDDDIYVTYDGHIAHFDGTDWTVSELPVRESMSTVKGIGDHLYAVDVYGTIMRMKLPTRTTAGGKRKGEAALALGNHPNPFNPQTTIHFDLSEPGAVSLRVFNVAGQLIRTLIDGELPSGRNEARWDGTDIRGAGVASGVYFYQLSTRAGTMTRKMLLMK